jgi:hypothetical protein
VDKGQIDVGYLDGSVLLDVLKALECLAIDVLASIISNRAVVVKTLK